MNFALDGGKLDERLAVATGEQEEGAATVEPDEDPDAIAAWLME